MLAFAIASPFASAALAQAQVAAVESKFEIKRFIFDGAMLVPLQQLERDTAAFLGKEKTFADVQRAMDAVERLYSAAGHGAVQVVLPEQELDKGEIRFQVVLPALAQAPVKPAAADAPAKPAASAAAKPVPEEPKFEIRRFIFDGAKLISTQRLEDDTAPFVGKNKTFADVQRALETIERLYSGAGYSAVQVVLPEQELDKGEIRFQIVEAKVGRVIVEGNKFYSESNIRASLPSLKPGESPNINLIARDLRLANESPAKQTTVLLRSGQEEATVDAVARVVDEDPRKRSITVDSSGGQKTGRLRTAFGFQHGNFLGGDEVLTFQYVTAPYREEDQAKDHNTLSLVPNRKVFIVGGGFRMPKYESGDSLDISAAYSNVNTGQVAGFNITGMGGILGLRYTQNFDRIGDYEHRAAYTIDHRSYNNKGIRAAGSTFQVVPDVVVHPVGLQYSGALRRQSSETGFSIGFSQNYSGGSDGGGAQFCETRSSTVNGHFECANSRFMIWRWSVNHSEQLPADWQARFAMNGQLTKDMLIPGEQFGVGGVDSVRGFLEREASNDQGHRGTVELYTPDWASWTGIDGARMRFVLFYDWGRVKRNRPGPGEIHGQSIAGTGLGIRFSRGTNFIFRTDYGQVRDIGGGASAIPNQGKNDQRVTFSLSYIY